jgi:O-antigen/teichoic acid export membrane protein
MSNRTRRLIVAVGAGYLALAANVLSTGLSIPVALHYLKASDFGLWAVVTQVAGYLTLLDFGFAQSVSRVLIDFKDEAKAGTYGAVFKAAFIVFALLGLMIVACGACAGPLLAKLLGVSASQSADFSSLLLLQCIILGVNMLAQPFGLPLWSHQRLDIIHYTNIAVHLASLLALWTALNAGCSYFSLGYAGLAGVTIYTLSTAFFSIHFKLVPHPRYWGPLKLQLLREVAGLSRDFFVLSVAAQLTSATQLVVVSHFLGFGAAGVWSICTKAFSMTQQLISRLFDSSSPALSEMVARGELARLQYRLAHIVSLSAVLAGIFAVLGAAGNRDFVFVWTGGRITWDAGNDLAAAVCLFVFCVSRCYTGMTGVTKLVGRYKYYALAEGVLVIAFSFILAQPLKFTGVFIASLIANLLCSTLFGSRFVSRYFSLPWRQVTWGWLKRSFAFILSFSVCCDALFLLPGAERGWRLFLVLGTAGLIGVGLAWSVGLDPHLRLELAGYLRRIAFVQKIFTPRASVP